MQPVDYSSELTGFRELTDVNALAPVGLPKSWRANAASLTHDASTLGVSMHIGFVTPDGRYAGLDESTMPAAVRTVLGNRGLNVIGVVTIGGIGWERRISDRGEQALTRNAGKVQIIVTGNATSGELQLLCGDLAPVRVGSSGG